MSLYEHGPNYDPDKDGIDCRHPKDAPANDPRRSLTRQSFAKDADINNLMARYPNGGVPLDAILVRDPNEAIFGDFSDLGDFSGLMNRVSEAQAAFMALPSSVRARFDNDVAKLLAFIDAPENVVEAVKLQLLPESMLDATFTVRPDLATPEWKAAKEAAAKAALPPAGEGSVSK